MKEFIYSLFENKKQKLVWVIYIIFTIFLVGTVNEHNGKGACIARGHNCWNILNFLTVFTMVFIVVALILRNRQRDNDNSKN